MAVELRLRNVKFQRQAPLPIAYKGHPITTARLDLLVEDELIVELKAVESLLPIHRVQVLSYLKAGSFPLGLLINFNVKILTTGVGRVISYP